MLRISDTFGCTKHDKLDANAYRPEPRLSMIEYDRVWLSWRISRTMFWKFTKYVSYIIIHSILSTGFTFCQYYELQLPEDSYCIGVGLHPSNCSRGSSTALPAALLGEQYHCLSRGFCQLQNIQKWANEHLGLYEVDLHGRFLDVKTQEPHVKDCQSMCRDCRDRICKGCNLKQKHTKSCEAWLSHCSQSLPNQRETSEAKINPKLSKLMSKLKESHSRVKACFVTSIRGEKHVRLGFSV